MSDTAFNAILNDVDSFSYNQIVMLMARLTQALQAWTILEDEEFPNALTQKVMEEAESGKNHRDFHLLPDLVVIYRIFEGELILKMFRM